VFLLKSRLTGVLRLQLILIVKDCVAGVELGQAVGENVIVPGVCVIEQLCDWAVATPTPYSQVRIVKTIRIRRSGMFPTTGT
jgi:hypothetical protein